MIRTVLFPTSQWLSLQAILVVGAVMTAATPQVCSASGDGPATPAHGDVGAVDDDIESATGFHGINLGEYGVRTYRSVSGQRNRIRFTIYATVKNEQVTSFQSLLQYRKNKVRDQVIVATRLVPFEDYDDPELKKFRRRIRLRLRRTLPELMIDDIYVSEFAISVENSS